MEIAKSNLKHAQLLDAASCLGKDPRTGECPGIKSCMDADSYVANLFGTEGKNYHFQVGNIRLERGNLNEVVKRYRNPGFK
jgi:hypothetical protein